MNFFIFSLYLYFKQREKEKRKEKKRKEKRIIEKKKKKKMPVRCDVCQKVLSNRNYLRKHIENVHEKKRHKCDQCEKDFASQGALRDHKLTKHEGKKRKINKKQCPHCNKSFNTGGDYNQHLLTHQSLKPFLCPFCSSHAAKRLFALKTLVDSPSPRASVSELLFFLLSFLSKIASFLSPIIYKRNKSQHRDKATQENDRNQPTNKTANRRKPLANPKTTKLTIQKSHSNKNRRQSQQCLPRLDFVFLCQVLSAFKSTPHKPRPRSCFFSPPSNKLSSSPFKILKLKSTKELTLSLLAINWATGQLISRIRSYFFKIN